MNFKKNPKTKFKSIDKLSKKEAKEQIEALRRGIEYHNYLYYVKNQPEISDSAYDRLFHRLYQLEDKFPEFDSSNSPTRRIGAKPVSELKKRKHASSMLSLNAALKEKEVKDFCDFVSRNTKSKEIVYMLEPKFDGLSVEIVYEKGKFKYGLTRGDGVTGEDISHNLKTIKSVPLRLRDKKDLSAYLSVRGEVFMSKKGFQKMNKVRIENNESPFANPRNAAAGLMRQLDSKKVADKPFRIFFYEILKIKDGRISAHQEMLEKIYRWGLRTNPENKKCSSFDKIKEYHNNMEKNRDNLDYDIDGIVIKVNNYAKRKQLGMRERSPRWALAWKFPPRKEVTKLNDIVVQVGRTGMLTPVALLEPVEVGGVTISRATLHNEEEVNKKGLSKGDTVKIIRAGDVIPEVAEKLGGSKEKKKKFSMPENCPSCGKAVYKEGAYYFCSNGLKCPAQLKGHLIHYASREAMNIEGLGDQTLKELVNRGMVRDVADLYKLKAEDFKKLEGFAEKSAKQAEEAIQKTKKVKLDRFLYALGIRHVGLHIARVLTREFRDLDSLRDANTEDFEKVNEIGPEIAKSLKKFFKQRDNRRVLDKLKKSGLQLKKMSEKKSTKLSGKTFVFTGELDDFTRNEAKEAVETLGGKASSSVSSNTDYVVVGENPGSKLNAAKKHKVKILDERGFKKIIGG
ncbi:MAG: NAD-dependent DNA ligase LigA [Candidatus Omnitrophica bacterium]|nr:NAD-dependent DNA ligase LigA [Candidatus Omnitrophota bacterium]MBD3269362.1 NAD-dependent DNA ligase LigA [Candidatus Omnitrophota bacterium]